MIAIGVFIKTACSGKAYRSVKTYTVIINIYGIYNSGRLPREIAIVNPARTAPAARKIIHIIVLFLKFSLKARM